MLEFHEAVTSAAPLSVGMRRFLSAKVPKGGEISVHYDKEQKNSTSSGLRCCAVNASAWGSGTRCADESSLGLKRCMKALFRGDTLRSVGFGFPALESLFEPKLGDQV